MKSEFLFFLMMLLCADLSFAQNSLSQEYFTSALEKSFPEGARFVHHEPEEEVPKDALSYEFYFSEVAIKNDTLHLSFVQKFKDYSGDVSIELVKQTVPIRFRRDRYI